VAIFKQATKIFAPVINIRSLHRAVARRDETRRATTLELARKLGRRGSLERFRTKGWRFFSEMALSAFSSEVDAGSREENASKQ
jgi:hypothetical protein